MLFTRCPECETTFRVTDETLKKANGQVRCGRCASVFNAYAELHDPTATNVEPEAREARNATGEPAGVGSLVNVATAVAAADETPAAADGTPREAHLSANDVERVLSANAAAPLPQTAYAWPSRTGSARSGSRSALWSAPAALALLALGAQAIHHFRSDLASHPTFGPWITSAYEALGSEITPSWDVHQYQIIDWVATAEPNLRGVGTLKITARIQNRGPQSQPYPDVQLRLKDRYETAVGSRMVTPAEYLSRDMPRGRLMLPGETTRAELEVVDPGPDAYGFDLDVCIEVEASLVTCGTDEVFL